VNVAQRAVKGAFFNSIGSYIMMAMGFFSTLILTRQLKDVDFGLFGFGFTLMMLFSRIRLWGLNRLIIAETDPDDRRISTQFWLSVGFSTAVVVVLGIAWPIMNMLNNIINLNLTQDVLLFAVLCAVFALFENEGLASTPENMLVRELQYGLLTTITTVSTFLSLAGTIILAAMGTGAWSLLLGYGIKTVTHCIGVWIYAPRRPSLAFSREDARSLLSEGRFLLMGGIGTFLAFQYDDLAVGSITDKGTLGSYRLAYNISLVPMAIIGGILGVANATYARVKESRKNLSDAVSSLLTAVSLVGLPASVGLAIIAPEFVILYLTEEHAAAIPMVQILLLYSLFRPLNDSIGGISTVVDRNQVQTLYGIVQSVTMLVLGTGLTLLWGANGAALAAGLTVVVGFGVQYWKVLRIHVDIDYARIFLPAAVSVGAATLAVFAGLTLWTPPTLITILLYKAAIFSVVYLLMIYITDRERLMELVGQLRRTISAQPNTAESVSG